MRAAAGNAQAEKGLIEPLGELVLAYIDESDRLQRDGEDERRTAELRGAFEALHAPLDGIYRRNADRLEKMSRAVMDADGDLEALYETADFKSSQATAANSLYYLNWLNYYGARASEGARRKELLQACESGFSQFAVGDHAGELVDESLLGRGLCYLELDNFDWARRDFEAVIAGQASAERKTKARLALLDASYRSGDRAAAIELARKLIDGGLVPADEKSVVRFYELQALLESADSARGAAAERYRSEAGKVAAELRRAGGGWGAKVDALFAASIKDPSQWAGSADSPAAQWQLAQLYLEKEDCAGAAPLLEKLLAGDGATGHQRDARYWSAVCDFRAGRYEPAAASFAMAMEGDGEPAFAADARYLRFKSLEALMAAEEPPAELASSYVAALRDLLQHHPDHEKSAEAHYRLGEYLQGSGEFAAAIDEYAKADNDAALLLRAAFGTLQCRFDLLRGASDPTARAPIVAAIGDDLQRYDERVAGRKSAEQEAAEFAEIDAKVTLLRAVHASLATEGGDARTAEILADFAARHPGHADLAAQAARMRLGALLRLRRFADAEAEMQRSTTVLRDERRADALRALAAEFGREARMSEAPQDAAAAARVAVELHALASQVGGEEASPRQQLAIAQLREKAGELDAAAAGYREVLAGNPAALEALRGLARIAEAQGKPQEALAHWAKYTETVRGGDTGWYRGQFEQARLQLAAGDAAAACARLTAMRTAMAGLQDEELRAALKKLFTDAGC